MDSTAFCCTAYDGHIDQREVELINLFVRIQRCLKTWISRSILIFLSQGLIQIQNASFRIA
jgi:hypothetical protein